MTSSERALTDANAARSCRALRPNLADVPFITRHDSLTRKRGVLMGEKPRHNTRVPAEEDAEPTSPPCIYCGSADTEAFDIGPTLWHVECNACRCGFPWELS